MRAKLVEEGAAKRGFAGADFAGELDKALALTNAVEQVVEGFAMARAVKQEARIWSDVERRFFQAVIFQIHAGHFTATGGEGKLQTPKTKPQGCHPFQAKCLRIRSKFSSGIRFEPPEL